jgi:hypothetical protein
MPSRDFPITSCLICSKPLPSRSDARVPKSDLTLQQRVKARTYISKEVNKHASVYV